MSEYSNHPFDPKSKNNSWVHIYNYIKPGVRVLDIGCSTGTFGAALKDLKKCEVIGVDIDRDDLVQAKKNLDAAYYMDADNPKLKKLGKFDVIIFADVLEHLVDPRKTLHNIKPLLASDGIVVFSIPHMAHMSVRFELLRGRFPYKNKGLLDRTHLHFYDRSEVENLFGEAGYKIAQMHPVVSAYPTQLLQKKLESVGLKYTTKFGSILKKTSGDIFQFVGCAIPAKEVKTQKLTYIMPQDEVKTYAEDILVENRRLWESEESLKKQITDLQEELAVAKKSILSRFHKK